MDRILRALFCLALTLQLGVYMPVTAVETNTHSSVVAIEGRFVDVDGTKLHYVEAGSGQPLVLLHGNDGTLHDFTESIFGALSGHYRTICFDRPGHGLSESPKGTMLTPDDQAEMLHKALTKLNTKQPLLVAHSWSASLALSYALQFPGDLAGVVLVGGTAYDDQRKKPLTYYAAQVPVLGPTVAFAFKLTAKALIRRQVEEAFAPAVAPEPYVKKFLSAMFKVSQLRAAARDEITLNPCLRRLSKHYDKISVPVVIVVGDKDKTVCPHKNSFALHDAIAHSKLIVVKGAGHELQFTNPQEILKAIKMAETYQHIASPAPTQVPF